MANRVYRVVEVQKGTRYSYGRPANEICVNGRYFYNRHTGERAAWANWSLHPYKDSRLENVPESKSEPTMKELAEEYRKSAFRRIEILKTLSEAGFIIRRETPRGELLQRETLCGQVFLSNPEETIFSRIVKTETTEEI